MSNVSVRMTLVDQVSSKMKSIANTSKATASQLTSVGKEIDKAFSSNAPDSFASKAGSSINSVIGDAESLGSAIDDAVSGFGEFSSGNFGGMESSLSNAASSADDLASSASKATENMEDLSGAAGGIRDGMDGIDDGADSMDDLSDSADDAGDSMSKAGGAADSFKSALKGLFAAVGGAVALDKIKDFGEESVQAFSNLETGMAEVSTLISGSTDQEMAGMTQQVRDFSLETGKLTSEIVPALYQSISASVPKETVFDFLEVANMAAVGGVTELETAVDGITSVINAYGTENLSAAQASDQMFTAVKLGKTTFGELANSLFNVIPTAVNAGVSFGDVTAAIATMTASGTPTSVATTQMRQALVELSDSGSQVGETFQKVAGKSFKEFLAEGHNTSEALNVLDEYAKSTGLSIDQLFSSVEAGNAAAQLTGGHAKTFADDIAAMGSSAGATEEAYGKMTDTFQHKTELLSAAWDDVKLDSGEALAEALSPAADSLLENMDEIKEPVVNFFSAIGDIISDLVPLLPGFLNALSSGLSAVGKIIGPLAKTMAGNPEAVGKGLTSIAAGMLAFKGINAASGFTKSLKGVEGITGVLGKLAPTIFSNPWAAGAAAVVGAVTAIGLAVHEYNKQQISNSLADHFGDIELTAAQIEDVAGHILNAKYLVNVEAALNEFQNADKLAEEAEAALAENDALEWKASIGMTWDESEVSEYISNIDEFISSSIEELESRSYAATITVETMLGGTEEGQTLAEQMKQWAVSDQLEMETLSQQLKSAVEKAMTDGVLDANEQAAITIFQSKMNNILASWKEADAQAELDLIDQKYGSASGKDLTAETFQKVVDELGKQREEAQKSLEESYTALMSTLHGLDNSGRLEETGMSFEKLQTQAGYAYRNAAASSLANSVNFEKNTLSDTYGDLLQQNYAEMEKSTSTFVGNARNLLSSNDLQGVFDQLNAGALNAQTYSGLFSSGDQKALANIYEAMKPDVSAMQSLMGEYREAGQAIPQELMTSFNEAMKVGAAAGDASAAWQVFANQMVEDAGGVENALNDSLISAIQDGTASAPQQLKDALDIALSETTPEPLTMDEVAVSLAGFDLDVSQIAELTGMTETEVKAALDKMGIEYDAEVDVNTKAGTVDASGAEAAGQQAEEAAKSAAGEDTTVEKTVTADTTYVAGTTDTSQVEDAANAELASGTAEQEIVTDTTYVPGTTDTSQVDDAANQALTSGTAEQEIVTNITYVPGNIDTSQVTGATEAALSQQTIDSTATTNVTATMGTDNFASTASGFASRFQSALTSAFAKTFTATTNASITVNYSIANPSKTITFSGGGSGTATVYAHASGGIFESPHYGLVAEAGPEAIIPLDGSSNAFDLWQQAGERLGLLSGDEPIQISPASFGGGADGGEKETAGGHRTIDININGSGKVTAGGGLSKDDVVQILLEKAREVISDIVEQDILVEGDGAYEY